MAQKRIDFFGQFQPTGVDNSSSQVIRQLAGIAEQAQGFAFQEAKKARIDQGRIEGQKSVKRDEQGNIIAPEMRGDYTFADQSYNEAAILAHRSEIKRDTKETLNRLQNEFELDPEGFRKTAESYKKGVLKGMPDEMRFVISEDIENEIVNRGVQLDDAFFKREKQKAIAAVIDSAADLKDDIFNAARTGNQDALKRARAQRLALMQRGVENGLLDPIQAKKDAESVKEGILFHGEVGKLESIFSNPDLNMGEKIQQATEIVDSKKNAVYKDLSPDQRDALNSALQSELNQQLKLRAEMQAQERKLMAQDVAELKLDAKYNRRPLAEIQSRAYEMYRDDQITEGEWFSIQDSIAADQAHATKIALLDDKVARRIAGDDSLVVSQKEVDSFYDRNIMPILNQIGGEEKTGFISDLVVKMGTVPTSLKNQITNNLRSQDPALIAESFDVIDRLDEVRGIESPVTPHDRAFAQLVNSLSQVMQPEEAINFARQQSDPRNKEMIEQRESVIKDEKWREDYADDVSSIFSSFMPGDKRIDAINQGQMQTEYQNIFEAHYKAGMDEDAARAKTEQLMKRNWKYSEVSERMMKYPPDDYYAIQGDTSYIKQQLNDYVRDNAFIGAGVDNVFLISDEETGRAARTGRPDYLVMYQTEDGELKAMIGTNPETKKIEYIRWSPDVKAQREKLKNMSKDEIMKLREEASKKRSILNQPPELDSFVP